MNKVNEKQEKCASKAMILLECREKEKQTHFIKEDKEKIIKMRIDWLHWMTKS